MTTSEPGTTKTRPMASHRKTSLAAGALYLLTFVSIPTLFLYDRVKTDPAYIAGPGPDTLVVVGGLPVFGFIGAPLLIAGAVGMLFGLWGPVSPLAGFGALFLTVWEFGMGMWLVARGFNPDAVAKLTGTGTGTKGGTVR